MKALLLDEKPARWVFCKAVGRLWPGVYFSGASNLRLSEIPVPDLPGHGWVRLRTLLGGICGTDLAMIAQRTHPASIVRPFTSFPVALGHENVAVIEELGSEVTGWRIGDRVVVEPSLSCVPRGIEPACPQCAVGRFALCERNSGNGDLPAGTMIGLNRFTSGSWAPRFVAHVSQLHAVPEVLTDEEAVVVDPIACSFHAVLRHRPAVGERVVVQGAGIIGMGVVMALRALGCDNEIVCLARHEHQAEQLRRRGANEVIRVPRGGPRSELFERVAVALRARRVVSAFGNQTLVGGADVVFDCVGSGQSLSDAMKFCRARGTVVAAGTSQITLVDTTALWFNEVTVVGAYGRQVEYWENKNQHTYELVMRIAEEGRLDLSGLLTHVFDVADYKKAFASLIGRGRSGVIKAAFRPVG